MVSEQILTALAKATGLKAGEIHLEVPENAEFGDYASNIALQLFEEIKNQKLKIKITNDKSKTNFKLQTSNIKNPHQLFQFPQQKVRKVISTSVILQVSHLYLKIPRANCELF